MLGLTHANRRCSEQKVSIGTEQFIDGTAPDGRYAAVFEDDGDTGYFYALDRSQTEHPIQDAMHIYNVANVTDRHLPSLIEIGWSMDKLKVALLINGHTHAIFDFSAKRGYCRTNFPPPSEDSEWTGHGWDDSAYQLFAAES